MSKAPAVDYALEIIEYMASDNGAQGIADISNALGINKNAVSRVLEALTEKGWAYMSDEIGKKYRLTLRPFSVISSGIGDSGSVKIAEPCLKRLNEKLGDSVYYGVKNGNNVLYLLHYESTKQVRINGSVGGEYPLNCAAPGKVLLAFSDDEKIKEFFALPVEKRTDNTITSLKEFVSEAEAIRKNGYATDNEEFARGIICISVPIFDCHGSVVAAIGISSLTLYDDKSSLINEKLPLIKECAREISVNLGYSGKEYLYE